MKPKYHIHVLWIHQNREWIATVDEFPSLSYFADTKKEALKGLNKCINDGLKLLAEENKK